MKCVGSIYRCRMLEKVVYVVTTVLSRQLDVTIEFKVSHLFLANGQRIIVISVHVS
jgi:hypothetical protein